MSKIEDWTYERKFILSKLPSFERMYSVETKVISQYLIPCKDGEMLLSKVVNSKDCAYFLQYKSADGELVDIIKKSTFHILKLGATKHAEKITYECQRNDPFWSFDQYIKSTMGNIIIGTVKGEQPLDEPIQFDLMGVDATEITDGISNLMIDL